MSKYHWINSYYQACIVVWSSDFLFTNNLSQVNLLLPREFINIRLQVTGKNLEVVSIALALTQYVWALAFNFVNYIWA